MLPIPNLNDQELNTILQNSLHRIQMFQGDWNDLDVHDPGVTFLELLAALKTDQMRAIDVLGSRNLMKFLKLMGIQPRQAECARTQVSLVTDHDVILPKGCKVRAQNIIFETEEAVEIYCNHIRYASAGREREVKLMDYDSTALDRNMEIFYRPGTAGSAAEKNEELGAPCFYLGFQYPLPKKKDFGLYFEMRESGPVRNPMKQDFTPLSSVIWEYYGIQKDEEGWHQTQILEDKTHGFLYSGTVRMKLPGEPVMKCWNGVSKTCLLRARCLRYGYEETPYLNYALFNVISFVQKDSKCNTVSITYGQFLTNMMTISDELAEDQTYELYIRETDVSFERAEDLEVEYMLLKQENGQWRLGTSGRKRLKKRFEHCGPADVVLKLVLYDRDFYEERFLGTSDGTIHQEYQLQGFQGLVYQDFELVVGNGKSWESWEKTDTLDGCGNLERRYILNAQNAAIRFGDNSRGKVPSMGSRGSKGNLCVISLSTTLAQHGHIKSFALDGFCREGAYEGVAIFDFRNADEGIAAENNQELIPRAQKAMAEIQRAVSIQDYRNLAMETPGLKLNQVTVIPLYRPGISGYPETKADNAVTLVVEPYNLNTEPEMIRIYIENVKRHMERYRLVTTRLYVTAAERIPLDFFGEIRVIQIQNNPEGEIENALRSYIDEVQKTQLGSTIYYGEICNLLEGLECVLQIKHLEMDAIFDEVGRNNFGDVRIPPHARAYFRNSFITLS